MKLSDLKKSFFEIETFNLSERAKAVISFKYNVDNHQIIDNNYFLALEYQHHYKSLSISVHIYLIDDRIYTDSIPIPLSYNDDDENYNLYNYVIEYIEHHAKYTNISNEYHILSNKLKNLIRIKDDGCGWL